LVIERLLFVLKEGLSWRAIHTPEISWRTVYGYFRGWTSAGIMTQLAGLLEWPGEDAEAQILGSMDSTHVKVHRSGCNPVGGQQAQAMGISRGGLNTKVHAIVTNSGQPLAITITCGNRHDNHQAKPLIEQLETKVDTIIADKAYDANATRTAIEAAGSKVCIPPKANRRKPATYDQSLFAKRHVVENFWEVLKRLRRIATRFEKLQATFEGFLHLAIAVQQMRGQFDSAQFRK
jgi:transposase